MKTSTANHELHPAPSLTLAEVPAAPVSLTRPRTLRAGDQRATCHALVAGWLRETVEESRGGLPGFATSLGVGRTLARMWTSGERGIPLGTLLAASPVIAAPVLLRATQRIESAPWRDEGETLDDVLKAAAGAIQVASEIRKMPVDKMPPEERSRLATWLREIAARLLRQASKVEKGER